MAEQYEQLEYLNCVFYCGSKPTTIGQFAASLLAPVAHYSKIQKGIGLARAQTGSRILDTKSISIRSFDPADVDSAMAVIELPESTHNITIRLPRRGAGDSLDDFLGYFEMKFWPPELPYPPSEIVWDSFGSEPSRPFRDGVIRLTLSVRHLTKVSASVRRRMIDDVIDAISASGVAYYGFVQCESSEETAAGELYGGFLDGSYPMHRVTEELSWWHQGTDRRRVARNIYWGNYMGAALAQRFREAESIVRGLRDWKVRDPSTELLRPKSDISIRECANDSLFLTLSDDPLHSSQWWHEYDCGFVGYLDQLQGDHSRLATWLRREMRSHGLLMD